MQQDRKTCVRCAFYATPERVRDCTRRAWKADCAYAGSPPAGAIFEAHMPITTRRGVNIRRGYNLVRHTGHHKLSLGENGATFDLMVDDANVPPRDGRYDVSWQPAEPEDGVLLWVAHIEPAAEPPPEPPQMTDAQVKAAEAAGARYEFYGYPEPDEPWGYRVDDYAVAYAPGACGAWPLDKGVVRLAPDTAYQAWSNQYVLIGPEGDGRAAFRLGVGVGRGFGRGAMVAEYDVVMRLSDGRVARLDGPAPWRDIAARKVDKVWAFLAQCRDERRRGVKGPVTAHAQSVLIGVNRDAVVEAPKRARRR